jgi:hypothetical protein
MGWVVGLIFLIAAFLVLLSWRIGKIYERTERRLSARLAELREQDGLR